MSCIYLDHAATTRPYPEVVAAMLPHLGEGFANPSSIHGPGRAARQALDRAREQVAGLLHATPEEIVFTSGGTEADNQALRMGAQLGGARGRHIVTSAFEHLAVLDTCKYLEEKGFSVSQVAPDEAGRVDPAAVAAALTDRTALVSLMLVNNEVGTLQPVREVAALARRRGIPVHTDAVQALGKVPVDVRELGVDLLSVSAHKLHGPKGAGALYVRRGLALAPLLHGGRHEQGRRAGTEDVPAIVGFGRACEIAAARLQAAATHVRRLRDSLEQGILAAVPGARLNGHAGERIPHLLNVELPGLDGELMMLNLDVLGIAVSSGAACSAGSGKPSHVLLAMGRSPEAARCSLRFSLDEENTPGEIAQAIAAVRDLAVSLRGTPVVPVPEMRP